MSFITISSSNDWQHYKKQRSQWLSQAGQDNDSIWHGSASLQERCKATSGSSKQRSGAEQSTEQGWKEQDLHSINPKRDTGWEKMSTREGMAEKAWMGIQHLLKGVPLEERLWRQWNLMQFKDSYPAPEGWWEQWCFICTHIKHDLC